MNPHQHSHAEEKAIPSGQCQAGGTREEEGACTPRDYVAPQPLTNVAQEPETEDDFLDAADEFEKSAGKWRAGDAAKSARFFQRAIDAYAAGLQKFPRSFDLAYNK